MTKDEDDWLSDFNELAQASARQNQMASEKDYATRLKLLSPRIERARGCDPEEELAKKVAASEALAGQRKFDAAADQLDAAFALAARLLETAAAAAAATESATAAPENPEPASPVEETSAEKVPDIPDASLETMLEDLPAAEAAAVEKPAKDSTATDLDAMLQDLPAGEAAAAEKPAEDTTATDLDAMLQDLPGGEAAAVEKPAEDTTAADLDAMLQDLPSAEASTDEAISPESDAHHPEKNERSS